MRLRILGCHGGESPTHRATSFLIDDKLLLDAGSMTRGLTVEEQIAIVFTATQGLLDRVPPQRVRQFEQELIERLTLRHADKMAEIRNTGTMSDQAADAIKQEAAALVEIYASK